MARTERESDRRREEKCRLVGAAEISKELAEWRRLQQSNLSMQRLLRKRVASVPQREQLTSTPERLYQKEQSRLSRAPDRKRGESEGGREPHLGE